MHKYTYRKFLAFTMAVMVAFTGCSKGSDPGSTSTAEESESTKDKASDRQKFDSYLNQLFKEDVNSNTVNLHYTLAHPERYGIKAKKANLGNIDLKDLDQAEANCKKEIQKLKGFNYKKLSKSQKQSYDYLMDYFKRQQKLAPYPYLQTVLSPTLGSQAQLPVTLCEFPLRNKEDVDTYLSLLPKVNSYFDTVIRYEKEQVKRGYFMSDTDVDAVLEQINDFTRATDHNYMIEVFNTNIDSVPGLSTNQKRNYRKENRRLILEKVIPAYENLYSDLKNLKGNGKNKKGYAHFKNGKAYYSALASYKTGSDKTVPQMIKATEDHLLYLQTEMTEIIKEDPSIYHAFLDLDLNKYSSKKPEKILTQLKEKIKKKYPAAADVDCDIKYVHSSLEETSSPAFYMIPAIDDYKKNVIYINKAQTGQESLYPTLAHEGYPGHLYQTTYFHSKKEHPIRYILDYPGYSEGWATYVEMDSYSYLDMKSELEPLKKLLPDNYLYNMALSARVDLGVNYEGWSVDQAVKYMQQYGTISTSGMKALYRYVIQNPANYLCYYIGYLEFMELKDYYKQKSGNAYDEKVFHKIILDAGPNSFRILKQRIDENL